MPIFPAAAEESSGAKGVELFGIGASVFGVTLGGYADSREFQSFVEDFAALSSPHSSELNSEKVVLAAIGANILEDGHVKDAFLDGATGSFYTFLKNKSFKSGKCNIERMRTTSGQNLSWVVVEERTAASQTAKHCFMVAVSLHLGFDLLEVAQMTIDEMQREIVKQ
jgi:hypothetical protein